MSSENLSSSELSDSIFRTITGGAGGAENAAGVPGDIGQAAANVIRNNVEKNNFIKPPPGAKFATYELPFEIEDIGMPVYLSGIIQLITVVILLSKKKMYAASISFFTIGLFMFTVHCVYAGKADKMGQFGPLCRNFSYLMILFPLINVILVLSSDYLKIWKHLKYNPGKMRIQLPNFSLTKTNTQFEKDVDELEEDIS